MLPTMATDQPSITVPVRVRYPECDGMGIAHHSVYPVWFEIARTELLRVNGPSYAELERSGLFIVVARLSMSFRRPARYDDELAVTATLTSIGGAKLEHAYQVHRGDELLCTGATTLACVDADGKPVRVPETLGRR